MAAALICGADSEKAPQAQPKTITPAQDQNPETQPQPQSTEPVEEPELEPDKLQLDPQKPVVSEKTAHILTTYVDEKGMVDYKTLRRKRGELLAVTKEFDSLHPAEYMTWSREEKLAFWINAYNIFTIKLIIDNYPIERLWYMIAYPDNSIKHIQKPWTKNFFKVMTMEYNLYEMKEKAISLAPEDPRVAFCLSYASLSSPALRNEPFYPDRLDEQMDEQIKKFFALPTTIRIDNSEPAIYMSDIFNWYKYPLIEKYGSVKRFRNRELKLRAYFNFIVSYDWKESARCFESEDYTVHFQRFDWRLNEQTH